MLSSHVITSLTAGPRMSEMYGVICRRGSNYSRLPAGLTVRRASPLHDYAVILRLTPTNYTANNAYNEPDLQRTLVYNEPILGPDLKYSTNCLIRTLYDSNSRSIGLYFPVPNDSIDGKLTFLIQSPFYFEHFDRFRSYSN